MDTIPIPIAGTEETETAIGTLSVGVLRGQESSKLETKYWHTKTVDLDKNQLEP